MYATLKFRTRRKASGWCYALSLLAKKQESEFIKRVLIQQSPECDLVFFVLQSATHLIVWYRHAAKVKISAKVTPVTRDQVEI